MKNKKAIKRPLGADDEENKALMNYEGGAKSQGSKKSKKQVTKYHCCCKYSTAITTYGVLLVIFGILIIINILIQFQNKYLPKWYPIVGAVFASLYVGGIVLFLAWCCKDNYGTRTSLAIAGYLILASVVLLIILCMCLVIFWDKDHENIKVGNGDDDSDYADYSRGTFFLNYLIGGVFIIALDVSLLILAGGYADSFPPEDETDPEEEKKMMEAM